MKTYTRARAAKAALQKMLDMHEVTAKIETIEVEAGRFGAKALFLEAPESLVQTDLAEAGFAYGLEVSAVDLAIIDMGEAGDATPYPSPVMSEEELGAAQEEALIAEAIVAEAKAPRAPKGTGVVAKVHAIADSMVGSSRKDVIAACVAAGINQGTARTQYQKWFSANKAK